MRILKINGSVYNGILLSNWSISEKNNSVSTLKCSVLDVSVNQESIDISSIVEGASIELLEGTSKLFSGIIKTITKGNYSKNILQLDFLCNDNSEIANRRIVAKSVVGKMAGWIVKNVILPVLSADGVTEGNIEDGFVLSKVNFNYISCKKALDYLQTCTGFNWNIDEDKKLNFNNISQVKSPFAIDNNIPFCNFKATRKYDQYRNVQYILGGKSLTSPQVNEELIPVPNGEIREFYSRFAFYQKPAVEIYTNGAWNTVNESDIGIKGIDTNKKYYFEFGTKLVEQDSSESVLASGDKIRATYVGLKNVFLVYENDSEIQNRANIENGSGKYEIFEKNESLGSTTEAKEYAESVIKKYGEIEDRISFDIEVPGLKSGQLLTVSNSDLGINKKEFLIESITIKPLGNSIQYSITALDGISLGGWENYFKALVSAKEETIAPDENVIFSKNLSDTSETSSNIDLTIRKSMWKRCDNQFTSGSVNAGSIQRIEVAISE